MKRALLILVLTVPWGITAWAQTQKLPPTTRTVYKCTVEGKVVYTDEPCLGAKRVDVEPTRGMNQDTGKVRMGADVRNEHHREAMAEILRPITGKDAREFDVAVRRRQLTPAAKDQCRRLDKEIAKLEADEAQATPDTRGPIQTRLWASRKNHKTLGC